MRKILTVLGFMVLAASASATDYRIACAGQSINIVDGKIQFTTPDSYTKLLLHFNGTNGSKTIVDSADATRTFNLGGGTEACMIGSSNYKFGNTAWSNGTVGYFQSSGDEPAWDAVSSSASYTIDCWIYLRSAPGSGDSMGLVEHYQDVSNNWRFFYYATGSGGTNDSGFIWAVTSGGVGIMQFNPSSWGGLDLNNWHHIAMVKNGTNYNTYYNGVSKASGTSTNTADFNAPIIFGLRVGSYTLDGWLDEVRISQGIARWTNNFTPPARSYNE